jgi:hypothetical protein
LFQNRPINSPFNFSKNLAAENCLNRGERRSLIWLRITIEGTDKILAEMIGLNLESDTTTLGANEDMFLISSSICFLKFESHIGNCARLRLTEKPESLLQTNSTGGTVRQS